MTLGISGNSTAVDGSIGFNTGDGNFSQDWEPAALTEIAHALGWDTIAQGDSYPDVADLFRYLSPGQHQWTSGQPAYFSIDGGKTDLADFGTSFDQTLFTDLPANDPLRYPFTSAATTLTSFDIEALSAIGFGVPPPVSPLPPPHRFIAEGNSSDILWRNIDGQASIWEMSGTNRIGGGVVSSNPGPSWTDVATGDFNDDGQPDILWQNANGQASIWEMNGNTRIGGGAVSANPGPTWRVVGAGDFNHDGFSDILWQNTGTGQLSVWELHGATRTGGAVVTRNRRFQPRRLLRHPVPKREHGPGRGLGDGREHPDRRRGGRRQPRTHLDCGRNR
jgi:FG-GAP-like repeat